MKPTIADQQATTAPQTKAQLAHQELERMIVTQEIAPGHLVSEADLMARTGLGRTPVREALQRLAREQMVEIHPHKGVLVPATSVESQLRLLEVRRPLEALAARLACSRCGQSDRERMRGLRDELQCGTDSASAYLMLLQRSQRQLVQAAGNDYLAAAIAPLHGLSRRYWYSHLRDASHEIGLGSALYATTFAAVLDRDEAAAEGAALRLNDYLVEFTWASLR